MFKDVSRSSLWENGVLTKFSSKSQSAEKVRKDGKAQVVYDCRKSHDMDCPCEHDIGEVDMRSPLNFDCPPSRISSYGQRGLQSGFTQHHSL